MKMRAFPLLSLALVAACSSERQPPPQPAPRPQARATPLPAPAPPPAAPAPLGWADLPLTPGTWMYEGGQGATSSATYGNAGAPVFRISCEGPTRGVSLMRYGAAQTGTMVVRTSFGARSLPLGPGVQPATASLGAREPFLDNIVFSRGRFSVEVAGTPMLVLPAWAEPARVVENCRK